MCLETMDTEATKLSKHEYIRHGFNTTWAPFRDPTQVKWAFHQNRTTMADQKQPRRKLRLAQRAKVGPFVTDYGEKKKKGNRRSRRNERVAAACMYLPPAGGMAPRNTTQYLMSNAYEDLKMNPVMTTPGELPGHVYCEGLSPKSVSAALDACFEDMLEYQLRDFEELYDLAWKPE